MDKREAVTKEIGYCYPYSPGATARGYEREGCWHLETLDYGGKVVHSIGAYATEAEVRKARVDA